MVGIANAESTVSYLTNVRQIPRDRIRVLNNGTQINVVDNSGVVQSYYPTTGTIVLHRSNRWQDFPGKNSITIPEAGRAEFGRLLTVPDAIKLYFTMEEVKRENH